MKQKLHLITLLLISLLFILASCGGTRAVRKFRRIRDISLARIQVKRTLTIGIRNDFPPLVRFNEQTNSLEGFDIDIAQLVCKEMNVKPEFKIIDWKEKERLLKDGEIDCIWSGFSSGIADDEISVSKPYIKSCHVIVTKKDSPLKKLQDLVGKNLGIDEDLSGVNIFRNTAQRDSSSFQIFYYENLTDCLSDFEYGNINGFICDLLIANELIYVEGKPYKILDEALSIENHVVGFRKQDKLLAKRIQEILENMEYYGKIKPIAEKWFGSDITVIGK